MQQAMTMSGKSQLCNWKTNRKSLSQARSPLKSPFESLNQLFQNKCGEWLQWNFCYWDVVERGPRSELSSYWARQTAAWPRGGGTGGTPLSSTHSPSPQPAVPLHLRPHPLTPPLFYVHINFLPPLSSKLRKEVFHHGRHKTLKRRSPLSFFHFLFPQTPTPNFANVSYTYVDLFAAASPQCKTFTLQKKYIFLIKYDPMVLTSVELFWIYIS